MKIEAATELLTELGHIYAVALAERGHNLDDKTPLMNGLAAYYMLDLKGEFKFLDDSVDRVIRIIYDEVVTRVGQKAGG
jgi:hypothetical protein